MTKAYLLTQTIVRDHDFFEVENLGVSLDPGVASRALAKRSLAIGEEYTVVENRILDNGWALVTKEVGQIDLTVEEVPFLD